MSALSADLPRVIVECQSARAVSSPPSLWEEEGSIAAQPLNCQTTITRKTSRSQATFSFYLNSTLSRCATKFFVSAEASLPLLAATCRSCWWRRRLCCYSNRSTRVVTSLHHRRKGISPIPRYDPNPSNWERFSTSGGSVRLRPAVPAFIPLGCHWPLGRGSGALRRPSQTMNWQTEALEPGICTNSPRAEEPPHCHVAPPWLFPQRDISGHDQNTWSGTGNRCDGQGTRRHCCESNRSTYTRNRHFYGVESNFVVYFPKFRDTVPFSILPILRARTPINLHTSPHASRYGRDRTTSKLV